MVENFHGSCCPRLSDVTRFLTAPNRFFSCFLHYAMYTSSRMQLSFVVFDDAGTMSLFQLQNNLQKWIEQNTTVSILPPENPFLIDTIFFIHSQVTYIPQRRIQNTSFSRKLQVVKSTVSITFRQHVRSLRLRCESRQSFD